MGRDLSFTVCSRALVPLYEEALLRSPKRIILHKILIVLI